MADFTADDLSGSRFQRVDLTGAEFRRVDLSHARFLGVDLSGAVMRGVELVDVRIDGEIQKRLWDGTVERAILGDPSPWDPLDLPWDEMPDTAGIPRDRQARPSLEEVLALRRDRMGTVRTVIDGVTDASLATRTEPVQGPGWPPPKSFEVRECLLVVLNEEWHHRQFVERDLDALETDARRQAT